MTSIMLALSATKRCACVTARSTAASCVSVSSSSPSPAKESGVTLTIPMTWVCWPQSMRRSPQMVGGNDDDICQSYPFYCLDANNWALGVYEILVGKEVVNMCRIPVPQTGNPAWGTGIPLQPTTNAGSLKQKRM